MGVRSLLLALGALLATGGAVAAGDPAGSVLDGLIPPSRPEGTVDVIGWVEERDARAELVVTLVPKGKAKLVADPGVVVTPRLRPGLVWSASTPVSRVDPEIGYFDEPPTLRLPFTANDGRPVEASVEYAYCLVDYQCLFGQTTVSALPGLRGGGAS